MVTVQCDKDNRPISMLHSKTSDMVCSTTDQVDTKQCKQYSIAIEALSITLFARQLSSLSTSKLRYVKRKIADAQSI